MRLGVAAVAICLCIVGVSAAQNAAAAMNRKPTNIPAQPLGSALEALAKERDLQVIYRSDLVLRIQSAGVVGMFSPEEALTKLLAGTGLTYRYLNETTVTILPASSTSATGSSPSQPSSAPPPTSSSQKEAADSGAFLLAQAAPGQAQSSASVESQQKNPQASEVPIQEIIVTAQKRSERLIDTPQSVTALTTSDLNRLGAVQFQDFANTVPGLSFTTSGVGFTQISLRGVTAGFDVGSTVGIYVDDVPFGSSSAFAQAGQVTFDPGLFDMDRIEILRGPQGTLYGASTMGGLIKYVSARPDVSAAATSGNAQLGLSGTQDGSINYIGSAVVNVPIAPDAAALRASGYYSRDGGYIDNVALGQSDANRSSVYGGRLDFLFLPIEGLTIRLNGFAQDISRNGESTADYSVSGAPLYGSLDQYRLVPEPFHQQFRLVSGTITYDFGGAILTSISSYQSANTQLTYDVSGAYVAYCPYGGVQCSAVGLPQELTTDKVTEEIRLASKTTGALDWLFGGFYTHESSENTQSFSLFGLNGQPEQNTLYDELNGSRYEEYAAFVDLTYHPTERLDVTGGIRFSQDRQAFEQTGSGAFGVTTPTRDSTENVETYLANARYHLDSSSIAYLRYATGYRPGGPNFTLNNPVTGLPVGPQTFQPDQLRSYEAGIKSETSDRRFSIDVDGYYIDWDNIRVAVAQNGFSGIENAGKATIRGSELTLTARPVSDFLATAAFAYQDARLAESAPAFGGTDGERLPNVPQVTGALNGDYTFSGVTLSPSAGATVRYVGNRMASFNGSLTFPQYYLPSYTTLDLRGSFTFGAVYLQLYAHNLFNKLGQLSQFPAYSAAGAGEVSILQPRTIGVTATTHF